MLELKEQLTIIADELNVREVTYPTATGVYTLQFDTVKREAISLDFKETK